MGRMPNDRSRMVRLRLLLQEVIDMNCIRTPSALEVLIHCHTSPCVHPRTDAPCVKDDIRMLLDEGMIVPDGRHYTTTEKGRFYLDHLLSMPFPVLEFKIPSTVIVSDETFDRIDEMLTERPISTNLAAQRLLRRTPSWENKP